MGKHRDEGSGWEVGEHDRGGRGDSKSNDSRGTPRGNNGPRTKPAVTMEEVKERTKGRDKK
jgi:hypothetical protein